LGGILKNIDSDPSVRIPPLESGVTDDVLLKLRELSISEIAQFAGLAAKEEDLQEFFTLLNHNVARRPRLFSKSNCGPRPHAYTGLADADPNVTIVLTRG